MQTRITNLETEIKYHDNLYWNENTPEISDAEYDKLVEELKQLDPKNPLISKVHSSIQGEKVKLGIPMLSLDKAYTLDEVMKFAKSVARSKHELFSIQPKYDGISALYDGNILCSRGDGEYGENLTNKMCLLTYDNKGKHFGNLKNESFARGEIVIRNDVFKTKFSAILKKDGKPYKNPRNAVAGIMGLKEIPDNLIEASKNGAKLTFVDYNNYSVALEGCEIRSKWETILEYIKKLPYPMDGVVIKLADEKYSESLGYTSHHPKGQIAFKFGNPKGKSKILDVEWSFGKDCLTPVAIIEPTELSGTTVSRASLHNIQRIIDWDIKIGDYISIERAGDVIPYIAETEKGEDREDCIITHCPCCGSFLVRKSVELCCVSDNCLETNLQRILGSIRTIGIERLGEPSLRKLLLQHAKIKNLLDIFVLPLSDIQMLDEFRGKAGLNMYEEIRKVKSDIKDYQLLASFNIAGIGITLSKKILSQYTLEDLMELTVDSLIKIDGIGAERGFVIAEYFKNNLQYVNNCIDQLNPKVTKGEVSNKPTICFTGKMPEKRSYYEELAISKGFTPVDSVTSDLTILVVADMAETSSKIKKAMKNGKTTIKSLEEWL